MNQERLKCYRFLINDDQKLLSEKAQRHTYEANEIILREGTISHALYIIRSGTVRVEMDDRGTSLQMDQLAAGEFIGIMSFLDESPMRVSAIANEPVTIDYLDAITMYSLLASAPGFASRFYLTLAVILSDRLSETIAKVLPPFHS